MKVQIVKNNGKLSHIYIKKGMYAFVRIPQQEVERLGSIDEAITFHSKILESIPTLQEEN
jgi:hypothetical protein